MITSPPAAQCYGRLRRKTNFLLKKQGKVLVNAEWFLAAVSWCAGSPRRSHPSSSGQWQHLLFLLLSILLSPICCYLWSLSNCYSWWCCWNRAFFHSGRWLTLLGEAGGMGMPDPQEPHGNGTDEQKTAGAKLIRAEEMEKEQGGVSSLELRVNQVVTTHTVLGYRVNTAWLPPVSGIFLWPP